MQPSNLTSQLSPKQREVLQALVSGSSVTAAATAAGLHRSTVHYWCRENTVFRAALRDAESQHSGAVLDGYRDMVSDALSGISALMKDPAAPASVRLRAMALVLNSVASADPYTKPAGPAFSTGDVDRLVEASSYVGSEEKILRQTMATQAEPGPEAQVARGAPCPCGSGEKFKRCCGRNAPGIVNESRAAA